jgi:hypothetical protein
MTELTDYLRFEQEGSDCYNKENKHGAASMTSKIAELEAQNKALWELMEKCGKSLLLLAADCEQYPSFARPCYAVDNARETLAAIQKAKELKHA